MGGIASTVGSIVGGPIGALAGDVLGTGLSILGQKKEGSEDAAALNYRAGLYAEGANATRVASSINEGNAKAATTRKVADQRAAYAANGIDVGSKVVDRVTEATQTAGDMDVALMHYNAMREAFGEDASAALYSKAAKNAKKAANLNIAGTLLSGAQSVGSKWGAFKTSGAIGSKGGGSDYSQLGDMELAI